ncbi:SdpI family protein [Mucilaginibacter litoreus]|uniref:SdpI family protein n=1 Tax=Mucilaginibacter litoreus TaxID=1048221 RepID=A0ABW3AYU5_9SPHI
MEVLNWLIGPQLIGLIFIAAAAIQKRYPPKEINALYGYRTKLSMSNQQNWDEGNRYSTRLLLKCGQILLLTGIFITPLMQHISNVNVRMIISVSMIVSGAITTVVLLHYLTERHLKTTFINKTE